MNQPNFDPSTLHMRHVTFRPAQVNELLWIKWALKSLQCKQKNCSHHIVFFVPRVVTYKFDPLLLYFKKQNKYSAMMT